MATTTAPTSPQTPAPRRGPTPGERRAQQRDAGRHRAAQALELRTAGHTYARIASVLGYTDASAAKKAVERALRVEEGELSAEREAMRSEQNRRINRLLAGCWSAATTGDTKAIAAATRLLERQARLNGLDAPTQVKVTDAMDEEIEALLSAVAAADLDAAETT